MPLPSYFEARQQQIVRALETLVPPDSPAPAPVVQAMRYTLLAPAKRVRPVLVLLTAELFDGSRGLPAACAVECVHAASLMLDDLPSMDDATLRRGQPAAHVVHGDAMTILAAFGLLNLAYGHLAASYGPPLSARLSSTLANAVGLDGLVARVSNQLSQATATTI